MTPEADFFNRAGAPAAPTPAPSPAAKDRLKRLQSRAMWAGWTLFEVRPGEFAFVNASNELERYPNSGWIGEAEVEQFLAARERERSRW
ncbi:MAG: hypothetical protein EBT03_07945 [Betaproteobacteria bacterium]|nr:hypothetical protein [Betaproteobacteria bacterium]NCA17027.1 hypothetical protein [Betaproteobacteria bacterium]